MKAIKIFPILVLLSFLVLSILGCSDKGTNPQDQMPGEIAFYRGGGEEEQLKQNRQAQSQLEDSSYSYVQNPDYEMPPEIQKAFEDEMEEAGEEISEEPPEMDLIPREEYEDHDFQEPSYEELSEFSDIEINGPESCTWIARSWVYPVRPPNPPWFPGYTYVGSDSWSSHNISYIDVISHVWAIGWFYGNGWNYRLNANYARVAGLFRHWQRYFWVVVGDHYFYSSSGPCGTNRHWNPITVASGYN